LRTIELNLNDIKHRITRPTTTVTIKNKDSDIYLISAIATNNIGVINSLSTYSLRDVISDIF
jgi:hypothetical protein